LPIDETERPIIELRNQTLFYSTAFLVFALALLMPRFAIAVSSRSSIARE
jgi:hypothetical protein